MAGFEVVVRPVVFPDIRPRARQSLPTESDPTQGFASIKGNPARVVSLPDSWTVSSSYSRPTETERRVDEARVYQKEADGKINRDNFVQLQIANRISMNEGTGTSGGADGKVIGGISHLNTVNYYQRVKVADNIEILERDKIVKSDMDTTV